MKGRDLPGLRRWVCWSLLVAAFLLTLLFLAAVVFPYPPLYLLATRLVNIFLGDLLLAGRALSLFSGLGIGVALALTVTFSTSARAPLLWRAASGAFAAGWKRCRAAALMYCGANTDHSLPVVVRCYLAEPEAPNRDRQGAVNGRCRRRRPLACPVTLLDALLHNSLAQYSRQSEAEVLRAIRRAPGPVSSENLLLLAQAGKTVAYDVQSRERFTPAVASAIERAFVVEIQ